MESRTLFGDTDDWWGTFYIHEYYISVPPSFRQPEMVCLF